MEGETEQTINSLSSLTLDQIDKMIAILEKIKKNRKAIEDVVAKPTPSGVKRLLCGLCG